MATLNQTVTGIKDEKVVLWVLVEQLKDTDRREACIVGSGRALVGYRPTEGCIVGSGRATGGYRPYRRLYCGFR
jgi:hypothetical protein